MRVPTYLYAMASAVGLAEPTRDGYRDDSQPIDSVDDLDVDRYLGKWYEIARFPNRFERDCAGVTAEYGMKPNGRLSVVNTCRKGGPDGPEEVAEGVADVVAPGKLKVTFVPWLPFAKGDYWVLYVAPDYSLAVVGEPRGKSGWVLSREPEISPEKLDTAVSVFERVGYDTDQLEMVAQ